ncbi:LysR family transcriptional regulator [Marinomonas primoryensis]|jgi:DNA-binding transcriptional LysR family regulator|uniref:LysR family transcriptional regulator n=1 Tax=Marinomonas primoryensis TaxID=178399 RepID=UPI003704893C
MDWKSIKFDWNHARAFFVTAEEGSLSAAARALQTTQSTLSRQVSALEQELGVTLFERIGRGLEITPSGLELIEYVKEMSEAANKFSLAASGRSNQVEGSVCISATEAFAVFLLPPLLKKLREQEPGISIELIASDASSDLRRREADIAIRHYQPNHSDLIARKLQNGKAFLYANPDYLHSIGNPKTCSELEKADFIGFANNDLYLKGLSKIGLSLNSKNFPYTTASHIAHWAFVKEGAGIGVMFEYIGEREPKVCKVSDQISPFIAETWVVTHRELRTNLRIRLVYDFLIEELTNISTPK